MSEATTTIPNPGSQEAIDAGCLCPKIDNHYGLGFPDRVTGLPVYIRNAMCPLHGRGDDGNN